MPAKTLIYSFKHTRVQNGTCVRPMIPITLRGTTSFPFIALLDTGCDATVIPDKIAQLIGLNMKGRKTKIFGQWDTGTDAIESTCTMMFLGKLHKNTVILKDVPVLIAVTKEGYDGDITNNCEMVLGIKGIFDHFDITFEKTEDKIILKQVSQSKKR